MKKFLIGVVLSVFFFVNSAFAMTFSQPVKIGEAAIFAMGCFGIKDAVYNQGTSSTIPAYSGLYTKGLAQFGTGEDALYFHYDARRVPGKQHYDVLLLKFGGKDVNNAIDMLLSEDTIIWLLKTDTDMTFYIFEQLGAVTASSHELIGKNKDGKFFKYFDTYDVKNKYLGRYGTRNLPDEWSKFHFDKDTIIFKYGKTPIYKNETFAPEGEFRFKWDEAAQWFSVEQIKY